jgi:signal transduction histidine kinase
VRRARLELSAVVVIAATLGLANADAARRAPGFSLAGDSLARVALGVSAGWAVVAAGIALGGSGWRGSSRLLGAAGCAWLAAGLATPGARAAPLFTLGLALGAAAPALMGHAVLIETGDGRRRADGVVLGALYLALVGLLGVLPTLAYDPASTGCPACPANLLGLADAPGTVAELSRWGLRLGLVAIAACVALVLWRLARAPAARRRPAWPVVLPGCAYLILVAVDLAHAWRRGFLGADSVDQALWTGQAAALLAVAAGVALLRAAARRRRSRLTGLVVELATAPRPGALRDALAGLLGDPRLELLHASSDGWIDADGSTRAPAPAAATTALVRDGEPVALLCHRPGLLDDPRVVREIERSVRLGLDHERLQAQLRLQLAHLRRSRADVAAASEAERRLLERDLHDGAQQRLAAFTFAAGLARRRVTPALDARLERAQREVQQALDELREVAHGLYPVALAEAGLGAAVESLGDRQPALRSAGLPAERYPPAIEETAYFVIASLADRWSPEPVTVTATRTGEHLVLELRASAPAPDDLVAIDDRLGALDGVLTIDAPAPGQTHVMVQLPCV